MKKLYIKLSLILIVSLPSCKKAVEVDPISTITSASFWKTENDAKGALDGMYVELRGPASLDLFLLGEARSETMSSATAGTLGYDRYYLNSLNTSAAGPSWFSFYRTINAANLLLKYVPDLAFSSPAIKNSFLAQAFTMRAYVYFALVRSWGGVPIRTTPTEGYDPATIQLPRSTKEAVFKLIKDDLDKALGLYTNNTFETGRNKWSKAAAYALKAEVYLWTGKQLNGGAGDFNMALSAINEIQTADVQLLSNYNDIFRYTNKGNKEVLMASRFQLLEGGHNYFQNMYVSTLSNVSQTTRDIVGALGVGNTGNSIIQLSTLVRDQFSIDDQRRDGTFFEIRDNANKFVTSITTKGSGVVDAGVRHFRNDVILYRYADVLLMKAEAKNALSLDPSPEINFVRQRAYGSKFSSYTYVNGTKAQNDDAILKERLLELSAEGKRWWDLVRFGKAFDLVPSLQSKKGQDYLLLFPIGTALRSLEPLVTENPGWQ
ncbi:MAG: RagB/SusD family nutrient uptake outer membrane protein [Phormidesmis sp. FL-bin-119]|nr:RagB/SusD family nutrient uptake outer membrane protein [Pedobacter sp.]